MKFLEYVWSSRNLPCHSLPVFLANDRWLREEKGIGVYVETPVKKELLDDSYFSCVQSCETGASCGAINEHVCI